MARSLEASRHTDVAVRIAQQPAEAAQRSVEADVPTPDPLFAPVAGRTRLFDQLPIRLSQYLELVAWSGKVSIHASPESSSAVPSPKSEHALVETLRTLFDRDPAQAMYLSMRQDAGIRATGADPFRCTTRIGVRVQPWLDQHKHPLPKREGRAEVG